MFLSFLINEVHGHCWVGLLGKLFKVRDDSVVMFLLPSLLLPAWNEHVRLVVWQPSWDMGQP